MAKKYTKTELEKMNKSQQTDILKGFGVSEIPKIEEDRIKLILKLQSEPEPKTVVVTSKTEITPAVAVPIVRGDVICLKNASPCSECHSITTLRVKDKNLCFKCLLEKLEKGTLALQVI